MTSVRSSHSTEKIIETLRHLQNIADMSLAIRVLADKPAPPAETVALHLAGQLGWLFGSSLENEDPRHRARAADMRSLGLNSPKELAEFSLTAIEAGLGRSAANETHRTEAFAEWWRAAIDGSKRFAAERGLSAQSRVEMLATAAGAKIMKIAAQGIVASHLVSLSRRPGIDEAYGRVPWIVSGERGGADFEFEQHFAAMREACRANPDVYVSQECLRLGKERAEAAHEASGSDDECPWDQRAAELFAVKEQAWISQSSEHATSKPRALGL